MPNEGGTISDAGIGAIGAGWPGTMARLTPRSGSGLSEVKSGAAGAAANMAELVVPSRRDEPTK